MDNILKTRRLELKLTLEQVGDLVGVGKSTVRKWETGMIENMRRDNIVALSKALDLSPIEILGIEGIKSDIATIYNKLNETRQSKVYTFAEEQLEEQIDEESYGNIVEFPNGRSTAAGSPIDGGSEDGQLQSMLVMDRELIPDNADELITVAGDSMEPTLMEGQQAFIRYQPTVEQGEIAIIAIEDEGVTCKRVYFNDSKGEIILESDNEVYDDMVFLADEIRIIGKVLL